MSGMEGGKEGRDQMEKDRGRTGFHAAAAHDGKGGGTSNGGFDDARVDVMGGRMNRMNAPLDCGCTMQLSISL